MALGNVCFSDNQNRRFVEFREEQGATRHSACSACPPLNGERASKRFGFMASQKPFLSLLILHSLRYHSAQNILPYWFIQKELWYCFYYFFLNRNILNECLINVYVCIIAQVRTHKTSARFIFFFPDATHIIHHLYRMWKKSIWLIYFDWCGQKSSKTNESHPSGVREARERERSQD